MTYEGQKRQGNEHGHAERHGDAHKRAEVGKPVQFGRLGKFVRQPRKILPHEEHVARRTEQPRYDERQRPVRPSDGIEQQIAADQRDGAGDHHGGDQKREDRAAAGKFQLGYGVSARPGYEDACERGNDRLPNGIPERQRYATADKHGDLAVRGNDRFIAVERNAVLRPPGKGGRKYFVIMLDTADENQIKGYDDRQRYERKQKVQQDRRRGARGFISAVIIFHITRSPFSSI